MPKRSSNSAIPVDTYLRGRGKRRWVYLVFTLLIALLLVIADRSGLLLETSDDEAKYNGQWVTVVRVVDGDTLDIDMPDGKEPTTRIRLWGIDTPEMAHRDPPRPAEPFAEAATQRARELVEGRKVHLTLEPSRTRGNYGRLLAFVELPDGVMLNETLIIEGLALADDRWNHRHLEDFSLLEREAKKAGNGLWGESADKQ